MAVTGGNCYSSFAKNTRFRIDWDKTDQWNDSSGCGSIIKWRLVLENRNQWYSNAVRCYAIYINGVKVHDGGTWSNFTSHEDVELIGWQYGVRIPHDNAGNEKTFNINYSGWFYSNYNVSASTDFTLPSIPRQTSITSFTIDQWNETTLKFNWATADTVSAVEYSTNNGSSYTAASITEGTSGYFYVGGLSPNTPYYCYIRVTRKDSGLKTTSSQKIQTTYKVPTNWLNSRTETSLTIEWSLDSTASYIQYSLDNGSWVNVGNPSSTGGTYTITGLAADHQYTVKTRVRRSVSNTTYDTTAITPRTHPYPYCTEAPNFTIGNSLTVKFYNPLNRSLQIQMYSHVANAFVTDLISIGQVSQYTFTPNADRLYASIPDNQNSRFNIDVWYNNNKAIGDKGTSYSVNLSACSPQFNNFEYRDTTVNDLTTAIGNDQILVQNVSNVNAVISTANKMVARKSATEKRYQAVFDNLNKTFDYSSSAIDTNLGIITGKGNKTFTIRAYDSRGIYAEKSKEINVMEYNQPVVNVTLQRLNNFEAQTTLQVSGTYTRVTIDNTDKNAIKTVEYRWKESTSSTWGSWNTMTIASQGIGSYRTDPETLTFDNTKQFNFEIRVTDKAKSVVVSKLLSIGEPLMFLHTNGILDIQKGLNSGKSDGTGEFYIKGQHSSCLFWKENGYGDKFKLFADFGNTDDANRLIVAGAVGGAGEDPALYDLMTIGAKTGYTWHKGNVEVKKSVNEDTMFTVTKTDTNTSMSLAVSQTGNGTLHGLYSWKLNKWIVVADGANNVTTLYGDITGMWNGLTRDTATYNGNDTWIPVLNGNTLQHTTKANIFSTGANVENDTTATVTSGYFGQIDVNRVIKTGKTVQFIFRGFVSTYIPDNTPIFTMPYNAKAGNSNAFMYGIGTEYTATGVKWGYLGSRMYTTSVNSGNWIHINHTYICE